MGVWLHVELHKFVDLSSEAGGGGGGGGTAPYVFIGTGLLVLFLATLACCCTVNEQPVLLYIVSLLGGRGVMGGFRFNCCVKSLDVNSKCFWSY